ncbi:hypothetical protein DFR50_120123 [Roseiarcus fermentans]|uniref:Integrase catalytic domain-containing protein n=1 Tax=Roseiarcus fermentans TaxID=1473586 RepID=A0A366F5K7_9HYPH|nr:hypothetical protein DFR50_120123 [Roseiarcus fermentans]
MSDSHQRSGKKSAPLATMVPRFSPRACKPYRARTKGKTENGVGYVKKNAVAGRAFADWDGFEAHLARWEREVANVRVHGTTGDAPMARFAREEAARLKPLGGRTGFGRIRELTRVVGNDCAVEVDANSYSVPWRLIGERVAVTVAGGFVRIRHGAIEVAAHPQAEGRRARIVDRAHPRPFGVAPRRQRRERPPARPARGSARRIWRSRSAERRFWPATRRSSRRRPLRLMRFATFIRAYDHRAYLSSRHG